MSDQQPRPVTRVRRPALAQPAPSTPPPEDPNDVAEREAIKAEAEEAAAAAEAEAAKARAAAPPMGGVRSEIRREGHAIPVGPGFEPRDGDVLVVSYPEVTLPLPRQFAMMKFGGLIYTRQLRAGDDVDKTFVGVATWLARQAETSGAAKYHRLVSEFVKKGAKVGVGE